MVFNFTAGTYLKYIKISMGLLGVCFLQVNVVPSIWFWGIQPDLFLLLALSMAMNMPVFLKMIAFVLTCGLLKDIFSICPFGSNAFIFGFDAAIIYLIFRYVYKETKWVRFIVVASVTIGNYAALSVIFKKPYIVIGCFEVLMNCLFLPFIGVLYNFLEPLPAKARPFPCV